MSPAVPSSSPDPTGTHGYADAAAGTTDSPSGAELDWAVDRLTSLGMPASGPAELVKQRPWSTVHRVPVDGGVVWVKASGGRTGYEAALTRALATWVPELVLTPLATDERRGWLLLPDGGSPLREGPDGTDPRVWRRFVREYAQLQRAVAPRASELLALGVPDQRPARLPALLDGLLDDDAVAVEEPARRALDRLRPAFADACAELAEGVDGHPALPATVQHDDLHAGNVLPAADPDGRDRFFDWGDAAVAHPLSTLLVTLRSMEATLGLAPDDPALRAVRDAYLAGWELEGPTGVRAARLAAWTGCVGRALAWQRALAGTGSGAGAQADAGPSSGTGTEAGPTSGTAAGAEWADAVPGWVTELLEPTPVWFMPEHPSR